MLTVTQALAEEGPLADRVEGFHGRPQQQAMAAAIERTLDDNGVLICEAGTGTGKTFAYLVAAVLSGKRVIVSTGTKNLQEQLFHRDLPRVRDALAVPLVSALLKGRANYLCLQRLDVHTAAPAHLDREVIADLATIREWAGRTEQGDRAELAEVPEGAAAWRLATSTTDNCLGSDCPHYADCHVLKARRGAQAADIVVVNHHLLFADLAIRQEGFGELLPGADAVIVDEAHQLPELATRVFGISMGSGQIIELARDARAACEAEAGDMPGFLPLTRELESSLRILIETLSGSAARIAWDAIRSRPPVVAAVDALRCALAAIAEALGAVAERGRSLAAVERRARDLVDRLNILSADSTQESVRWLELGAHSMRWHASPLEVADLFSRWTREQGGAWILTSATLAVGGRIELFAERLGLGDARMRVWESPFDFAHQTLCYLPPGLPEPRDRAYVSEVVSAIVPVLRASEGRAFVLFTSHQALRRAAQALEERLDYPLLVQGSAPRDELVRRFRTTPRAVLLGTASFWEGVDVRGEALSCVIIDKLPFAPPDDPINEARARALKAAGRDPFMEHQLPQAVIALKQGVGRLIRDADDRGVVVLCDPRLLSRAYGRVFIDSLPPMPTSRDIDDVVDFFTG
ncbi:MAG: ATP-dependent DNA helicase [Gammaproteobacteria bacterium]|nr:MAG: ATP-dependent DNA helicase [Gammaproteobacteria bacterium]